MGKPEKEAELDADDWVLDPPPPYPGAPEYSGRFPRVFNLYSNARFSGRHYHIGLPHTEQTPLFAIECHEGWSGKPDVILHAGPTEDTPALATAKFHSMSAKIDVMLVESGTPIEMRDVSYWKYTKTFMLPINGIPERFEWRRSRSEAAKAATGTSRGFKLVRLGANAPGPANDGNGSSSGLTASERGEIVAAGGQAGSFKGKKAFQFQFLGRGLSGEMGEEWALGAAITGIAMFIYVRRAEQAAAAAASASGS